MFRLSHINVFASKKSLDKTPATCRLEGVKRPKDLKRVERFLAEFTLSEVEGLGMTKGRKL